jgi:poly-gamma-glutamate synthesis protein (capsule biosynthesis protein)
MMRNSDDSNNNMNSDSDSGYEKAGRQYRSRARGKSEEEGGILSSAADLLGNAASLIGDIGKRFGKDDRASSDAGQDDDAATDGTWTDGSMKDGARTDGARAGGSVSGGVRAGGSVNGGARTDGVRTDSTRTDGVGSTASDAQASQANGSSRARGTSRAYGASRAAEGSRAAGASRAYGGGSTSDTEGRSYGRSRAAEGSRAAGASRAYSGGSTSDTEGRSYGRSRAAEGSRAAGATHAYGTSRAAGAAHVYGTSRAAEGSRAAAASRSSYSYDDTISDYAPAQPGLNEAGFFDDKEHENDIRRTRARSRLIRERRAAQRRINVASSLSILAIFAAICFLGFTGTDSSYPASQGTNNPNATGIISSADPLSQTGTDGNASSANGSSGDQSGNGSGLASTDNSSLAGQIEGNANANSADPNAVNPVEGNTASVLESTADPLNGEGTTLPQETVAETSAQTADPSQNVGSLLKNDALPVDKANSDKVTILSAGDNLIHSALIEGAKTADGYDFSSYYAKVQNIISAADIATVNQEAPIASSIAEPSGYPIFNTPEECGDALIQAGFDVLNLANNHVTDLGEAGVEATLNYCDSRNITSVGMYRNTTDRAMIRTINRNGIRVAFLGFLDTSNVTLPENTNYRWTKISWESQVQELITKAKSEADIVVVHAHWGDEDEFYQTPLMTDMAQKMVNWGADVIFGSHPHVLQKMVLLKREGTEKLYPVIYSLGNFISGQQNGNKLVSGMLQVTAYRDRSNGATMVDDLSFFPIVTHYTGNRKNLSLYPVSEYSEELAAAHGVHEFDTSAFNMTTIKRLIFNAIPAQYVVGVTP